MLVWYFSNPFLATCTLFACFAHRAGPLIGEVLEVKPAPIEYCSEGERSSLRLGDFADSETEGLPGQDGADVTIANHPFTVVSAFCASGG
jgi:hypothetical protein